jgi:hypothetical protein
MFHIHLLTDSLAHRKLKKRKKEQKGSFLEELEEKLWSQSSTRKIGHENVITPPMPMPKLVLFLSLYLSILNFSDFIHLASAEIMLWHV